MRTIVDHTIFWKGGGSRSGVNDMQPESTFYPSMVHADHTHIVCACVPDAAAVTWGCNVSENSFGGY